MPGRAPVPSRRQVKVSVPKNHISKVSAKSKSSHTAPVRPKNYAAWYVALNTRPLEKRISHIPQIKWTCPPKLSLNNSWRVAAGEGSHEAMRQFSHVSAIPPSPLISLSMECEHCDDSQTPVIPTIPIEEAELDTSSAPLNCTANLQPLVDPSRNLTSSQCNDQSVEDKSLEEMLRGLGECDLEVAVAAAATVAAVMESKEQIDTQLLIKFLTDPEMVKKLIHENGLNQSCPLISRPPALNQSLTLPCSKAEALVNNTEGLIFKPIYASKPASHSFMPDVPTVKFSQQLDQARPLISTPPALNQSFTPPCSKAEESVNNTDGLKLKQTYASRPAPLSFIPDGPSVKFSQPLNRACHLISRPPTENHSFTLPCSKAEASIDNSKGLNLQPTYASGPASLGFMPDGHPIKQLISEAVQPAHSYIHPIGVAKQVSHLSPSTSRPDVNQMNTRIYNKYREPHLTRVNPVAPINPSSPKPNVQAIKKLINEYGASDARPNTGDMNEYGVVREHAWGKPLLEQNPLLLASTPLKSDVAVPPTANLHVRPNAFSSNYISTSNFHFPSFANVSICPPPVGLNYYKSPIFGQTGNYLQGLESAQNKTSIEVKPKYEKPCMYFNSTRGCMNGFNCSYKHDMSKPQTGVFLETPPVTKRMKFLN